MEIHRLGVQVLNLDIYTHIFFLDKALSDGAQPVVLAIGKILESLEYPQRNHVMKLLQP